MPNVVLPAVVGLLPVACFLAALLYLDSYKLVRMRVVLTVVAAGAAVAVACYLTNATILNLFHVDFTTYSRYVAPVVEELLKAAVIVWLIHANRVGFLVDAAIFGFTVEAELPPGGAVAPSCSFTTSMSRIERACASLDS